MSDVAVTALLIVALFALLGSGVWIGLTLAGVAWIGMQLFSVAPGRRRDGGHDLGLAPRAGRSPRCRCSSGWARSCSARGSREDMFRGLAPWMQRAAGPAAAHQRHRLRDLRRGVGLVSAATCATIGKMTLPELKQRGYPERHHDRLAGRRRHARPADPAVDHHDRLRRHAPTSRSRSCSSPACIPGIAAGAAVLGLHRRAGRCVNPDQVPPADRAA